MSGALTVPPGPCISGQVISLALLTEGRLLGVLRLCNFGLFGEDCAVFVREPITGRGGVWATGSVIGELGPRIRSFIFVGLVPVLSALERSRGVSLLAALSTSDLRTLEGSSAFLLLPKGLKKERFFFSFSAAFFA